MFSTATGYFIMEEVTKYPIEEGNIIRLIEPMKKYNPKLPANERVAPALKAKSKIYLPHTVFLWILRKGRLEERRQPKDRMFTVKYVFVPQLFSFAEKYFIRDKRIRKVSICRSLKDYGYELIGNIPYEIPFEAKEDTVIKYLKFIKVMPLHNKLLD